MLLISMTIMIAAAMATSVILVEQSGYDNGAGTVSGAGVSGDSYVYGEDVSTGSGKYRLAYSLISGDNYKVAGWYDGAGYSEPSGDLQIPSTINVGGDKNVAYINSFAFRGCTGLTSITIPGSVTSIGSNAFAGQTAISVDPENANYSSENGVLYNKNKTTLIQYPAGRTGGFTVPDSITSIDQEAFYGCTGLTSISIGDGLLTISLKYDLRTGEDPDNLSIWFVNDDGTVEKYTCTYSDGYVTFVTTHLSYYSVMYFAAEDEGFHVIYIAAAVIALVLIAAAVLVIRKRA